jgi:CRISPR system Cascade subunit CasA
MTQHLLEDPWIPIRRHSGQRQRIAPWQITESDDPIIALDTPRPDDNAGLFQFLTALLQTTVAPGSEHGPQEWADWLESPPAPETLRQRFQNYANCFHLFDEQQPFMQDLSLLAEDNPREDSIDTLLIDNNEIHFNKPGRISGMCAPCAATALFTLQTNSPEGGRRHYTSIRGGGPLTTFVVFDPEGNQMSATLWHNLWLNVLEPTNFAKGSIQDAQHQQAEIFPWLDPKRFVKAHLKRDVLPEDIHPLQVLWGMPRRIVLQRETGNDQPCGICGERSIEVKRYLTRPNGISYSNEPVWRHPWSPHYAVGNIGFAPRHPQPGGFSYRHWPGLVTGSGNNAYAPAKVISHFAENRQLKRFEQLRVWAFGYDMKNNKARCWYETTLPLILLPETMRLDFAKRVEQLTNAAAEVAGYLKSCVKEAWFSRPSDVRGDDAGFLAVGVAASFYERTEQGFYELLKRLRDTLQVSQDDQPLLHQWHGVLSCSSRFLSRLVC